MIVAKLSKLLVLSLAAVYSTAQAYEPARLHEGHTTRIGSHSNICRRDITFIIQCHCLPSCNCGLFSFPLLDPKPLSPAEFSLHVAMHITFFSLRSLGYWEPADAVQLDAT